MQLKLYLILQENQKPLLVCTTIEHLKKTIENMKNTKTYFVGYADLNVPPGIVAEIETLHHNLLINLQEVTK